MRFWDASAIVPLLIENTRSQSLRSLLRADPIMAIWWVTQTECVSALARLEREGLLHEQSMTAALSRLHELAKNWEEVDPSDAVREAAARFLRVHPLRAADALQMAAAFLAAEGRPSSLELVTLDERLAAAAQKEGFALADLGAA